MPGGDSVKLVRDDQYIRRIHAEIGGSGKLQRGSATRVGNASIPSKFQTFVMSNGENKGFSSQSRRFTYTPSEGPGPGAYGDEKEAKLLTKKPSHSKAGFGPMTSKAVRFSQKFTFDKMPAPNVYDTSGDIADRRDFSRSATSYQFCAPISVVPKPHSLISSEAMKVPGPNRYEVVRADKLTFKKQGSATTPFKSTVSRSPPNKLDSRPGPGYYEVDDETLKSEQLTSGASHCFVSASDRLKLYDESYKSPGPAAYNVRNNLGKHSTNLQLPSRKHFLSLSAPAIPPASSEPLPGPGHYEVGVYTNPVLLPMSSAAFLSNSSRLQHTTLGEFAMPSPATYKPAKPAKQSFLFNGKNQWVC